jgi:hypothetical protein
MRRVRKIKLASLGAIARQTRASSRRTFSVWGDAGERGGAFPALAVTQRVRDGLVLRLVGCRKTSVVARNAFDGPGTR